MYGRILVQDGSDQMVEALDQPAARKRLLAPTIMSIAKAHGGGVTVESSASEGTVFLVTLPGR